MFRAGTYVEGIPSSSSGRPFGTGDAPVSAEPPSIGDVLRLTSDASGALWIGASSGLLRLGDLIKSRLRRGQRDAGGQHVAADLWQLLI